MIIGRFWGRSYRGATSSRQSNSDITLAIKEVRDIVCVKEFPTISNISEATDGIELVNKNQFCAIFATIRDGRERD